MSYRMAFSRRRSGSTAHTQSTGLKSQRNVIIIEDLGREFVYIDGLEQLVVIQDRTYTFRFLPSTSQTGLTDAYPHEQGQGTKVELIQVEGREKNRR